jgi:hypothetical protein
MPVAYESIKLAPYLEVMVADSDGMFYARS